MSAERPQVSAELEGLLRELAADPRASLLAVRPERALCTVLDLHPAASTQATGLIAAERELLRVHRAELAYLLRHACVARLFSLDGAKAYTIRHVTREVHHEPLSAKTLQSRLERELQAAPADALESDLMEVVRGLVSGPGLAVASVAQLAAASVRLAPSAQAGIYAGEELAIAGECEQALRLYESTAERYAGSPLAADAHTNAGALRFSKGDAAGALEGFTTASSIDSSKLMPLFNLLRLALLTTNTALAVATAAQLDAKLPVAHAAVDEYIAMQLFHAGPHQRRPSYFHDMLSKIESRLGPTSSRVAHEVR